MTVGPDVNGSDVQVRFARTTVSNGGGLCHLPLCDVAARARTHLTPDKALRPARTSCGEGRRRSERVDPWRPVPQTDDFDEGV